MLQNLSPIQNHILSKLKNAKSLKYSELQPEKVPNDLFNYHLQFLVKKNFLVKFAGGYALSSVGIKHVADPYPMNDAITSLFKINVITIVSRKVREQKSKAKNSGKTAEKIEILNQIRMSNPSYGKIGIPGGVVLKAEFIRPAATRKLKQETGLDATFHLVGCERRIMYKSGELAEDTQFGHNMWVPIDEAIKNESAKFDSIQGIVTVLKAIKKGSIKTLPFFFEETIQSDDILA